MLECFIRAAERKQCIGEDGGKACVCRHPQKGLSEACSCILTAVQLALAPHDGEPVGGARRLPFEGDEPLRGGIGIPRFDEPVNLGEF